MFKSSGVLSRAALVEKEAAALLADVGNPTPSVSALALADAFGIAVYAGFHNLPNDIARGLRARSLFEQRVIEVHPDLAGRELHETIARELGHWALRDRGIAGASADHMAAALMMPLSHALDDLLAPINSILLRHAYCSIRLIEVRRAAVARLYPSIFPRSVPPTSEHDA